MNRDSDRSGRLAGVLGAFVLAALVVTAGGAFYLKSSPVAMTLPPAAAVVSHPVTAPLGGVVVRRNAVTVVSPVHPVEVYEGDAGPGTVTLSPGPQVAGGPQSTGPDAGNDTYDDQSGPASPSAPTSEPPGATANPPAPTTTTTKPGSWGTDDNGSDDGAETHTGSTTTTTGSGQPTGSSPTTTGVDR